MNVRVNRFKRQNLELKWGVVYRSVLQLTRYVKSGGKQTPRDRFARNLICIQTDVAPAIPNPAFGHAQRRHFRENLPTQLNRVERKNPGNDFWILLSLTKENKKIILRNKLILLLALFYVFLLLVSLIYTKTLIKRNNRIELIENILGTSRAVFS